VPSKLEAEVGIGQLEMTLLPRPKHLDLQANHASTLVPQWKQVYPSIFRLQELSFHLAFTCLFTWSSPVLHLDFTGAFTGGRKL